MDTHKLVNRVAVLIASTLVCILCCIPSGLVLERLECVLSPISRITQRNALKLTRPLYSSELIFDSLSPDVKVPPPRGI